MANPTVAAGLAYAVLKVPIVAKTPVVSPAPVRWKKFTALRDGIFSWHKKPGMPNGTAFDAPVLETWTQLDKGLTALISVYKDLGIADQAVFDTLPLLAGVRLVRIDTAEYGSAMVNHISAFQSQGVNFIVRAFIPDLKNEAAARRLGVALSILYGADFSKKLPDFANRIEWWRYFYRNTFWKADVLGILHNDNATGQVVHNLNSVPAQ